MSSSPRITRTVSGRMSSSRSTSFARRPPATSTSRRGFRKMTFTGSPRASRCVPLPSRLREPPRALHVADLSEMDPVVPGLKLPPLREVEIAEAKVVEAQRAWIHRPELLHGLSAPFSRGPHGRDQLADRFIRRRPHHRRRVRRPRRIGPVGAGTPPPASSVLAKTFPALPPSTGSTRCVARPSASTRKTPAGLGAPSPIVYNSYVLRGGGGGRFATKSWPPPVWCQITHPVAPGLGPRPRSAPTPAPGPPRRPPPPRKRPSWPFRRALRAPNPG